MKDAQDTIPAVILQLAVNLSPECASSFGWPSWRSGVHGRRGTLLQSDDGLLEPRELREGTTGGGAFLLTQ